MTCTAPNCTAVTVAYSLLNQHHEAHSSECLFVLLADLIRHLFYARTCMRFLLQSAALQLVQGRWSRQLVAVFIGSFIYPGHSAQI